MAENIITTVFMGRDMMGPTVNSISGQLNNLGNTMVRNNQRGIQSTNMLSREWDTFQRHMRYAVAGFGTYEIFNAISKLRDYQTALGQLNSTLGTTPQALGDFGRAAIDISLKTSTPLNDVLQSMNNIATSIPNLSRAAQQHLIPAMAQIEAMGSRISGIDPRSFGATILGLATAFRSREELQSPGGPAILSKIASQVLEAQKRIPNPAGDQAFYSALPMLAGGAFTGQFTLEQALAMYTVAQRVIQRPQTTAQYLRQLMIRIHAPAKQAQTYFNQAGLTPDVISRLTGPQILNTILLHALSLPGADLGGATPEQFIKTGSWRRLNVTGQSAQYIQRTIGGRIQSLVAARALVAGIQQLPQEEQALKDAVSIQTRFNRAIQQMPMQQAQTAISDMTTSIMLNFQPGLDAAARGLTQLSKWSINASKRLQDVHDFVQKQLGGGKLGAIGGGTAEIGLMAGGGLLASRVLKGLFSKGEGAEMTRASALLRRVPGLGRLLGRGGTSLEQVTGAPLQVARPMAEVMAAQAALAGTATGTMDAPFWVVIHPLTMSQIPALSGKGPIGGGLPGDPLAGVKGTGEGAAGATLASRLRGFLASRSAARAIGGAGAAEVVGGAVAGATAILGGGIVAGLYVAAHDKPVGTAGPGGFSIRRDTLGYYYDVPHGGGRKVRMTQQQAESALKRKLPSIGNPLAGAFMTQLGGHNVPRGLQSYFSEFESGKITGTALDKAIQDYARQTAVSVARRGGHANSLQQAIINMFRLTQGHQLRLSRIDRRDAAQGYVEATLNLEPTQAFANLLQPQQVKVHIPIGAGQPAPKSRAKANTRTK